MAVTTEDLAERIRQLIDQGNGIPPLPPHHQPMQGPTYLDVQGFARWRSRSAVALQSLLGADHPYTREFNAVAQDDEADHRDAGVGVLISVLADLEAGYLDDLRGLIAAEVFSDFLGMAQHLLEEGYHVAAASLAGAVLEDALRRAIARAGKVPSGNLPSYNQRALDGGLYGPTVFTQVKVWIAIRDAAAHGEFDAVDTAAVTSMLRDLPGFMSSYLGLP
jgi:hypothetical protein